MNRKIKTSLVIALAILLCGGIGFAYRMGWLWETAEQKKVKELQTQLATTLKEQKSFGPRPQMFESFRQQVASLPERYQQQFRDSARNIFRNEMERRVDDYLKMSPAERRQEIDKRITEMEQMRKQFDERRKQEQAKAGTAVASAGGAPTGGAGGSGANGPPPANGPRGGPFGGPPGGRGLAGILDNTSPEFRAKMGVVLRDMEQRRKELGLPPMGPPGRPR